MLDSVRKMVNQGAEPMKIEIDTLVALASLRLFSKAPFDVFENKEMQSALKLLYQALGLYSSRAFRVDTLLKLGLSLFKKVRVEL